MQDRVSKTGVDLAVCRKRRARKRRPDGVPVGSVHRDSQTYRLLSALAGGGEPDVAPSVVRRAVHSGYVREGKLTKYGLRALRASEFGLTVPELAALINQMEECRVYEAARLPGPPIARANLGILGSLGLNERSARNVYAGLVGRGLLWRVGRNLVGLTPRGRNMVESAWPEIWIEQTEEHRPDGAGTH